MCLMCLLNYVVSVGVSLLLAPLEKSYHDPSVLVETIPEQS